jgi:hypothetical protein
VRGGALCTENCSLSRDAAVVLHVMAFVEMDGHSESCREQFDLTSAGEIFALLIGRMELECIMKVCKAMEMKLHTVVTSSSDCDEYEVSCCDSFTLGE